MQRSNAEEQFIENFSLSPSSLSLEQGSSSVTSTQTKQLNPLTFDKTREERIVNTTTVTLKLLFHEYAMWCIAIVRIALTAEILQAIFLVFIFSILFYFPSMIYKWFYVQSNLFPVPPSPPKSYLLAAILHQKQKHFSLKPPIITLWNLWALWGENRKKPCQHTASLQVCCLVTRHLFFIRNFGFLSLEKNTQRLLIQSGCGLPLLALRK